VKPTLNNPVVRSGSPIPMYPTGDRVAVERLPVDEETIGGLVIPGMDREKNLYCTVIAAGPVALDVLRDMAVEIGDTVCIGKYSGVAWEWRPKGILRTERVDIISVKDVLGAVELVEKIMDGRLGIQLHQEKDGVDRYRFFEEVAKGEAA
jgi:co-chaperonin GroES (HSP10)